MKMENQNQEQKSKSLSEIQLLDNYTSYFSLNPATHWFYYDSRSKHVIVSSMPFQTPPAHLYLLDLVPYRIEEADDDSIKEYKMVKEQLISPEARSAYFKSVVKMFNEFENEG